MEFSTGSGSQRLPSRMERRRKEWEGKMISRKIIIELVEGVNRQIVIAAMEGIIDEVFEGAAKE